ncbi:MAG: amidohydrolase family protein, partial [Candidatus Hodarchaeales archaeon]
VKEAYKDVINLQIVAFPQEGILKDEGTEERLYKAIESGATLIGGMPHNEDIPEDSERHIDIIFDIAKQFDVNIDSHTDETDDPNSRTLQYLVSSAIKRDFQGRVTVGHICSLASQNDYYAARVINLLKRGDINVVTNPPTNMVLQGRLDKYPKRTGITRVKELLAANINVSCGQDCINDPYYPFGKGDMLEVASLTAHAAKMTSHSEIARLYEMITSNAAKIMGFSNHQMKIGSPANLVILNNIKTIHDAIRLNPPSRTTIRRGNIISRTSLKEEFFFKGVEGEE